VHSLVATANYGDFQATFISLKIQKSIVQNWTKNQLFRAQAAYVPEINSAVFAVTDSQDSSNTNRTLWFYNIQYKKWFTWRGVQCSAMFAAQDQDQTRLYLGQEDNRMASTFNGNIYDVTEAGSPQAITPSLMTGVIYVDNLAETIKAFKRVGLAVSLTGATTITVKLFIDNFPVQTVTFTGLVVGPLLGSTFILGQSILGASEQLSPVWQSCDGTGRGVVIQVQKSDMTSDLAVQGVFLEWEPIGTAQEVRF
jgi:hypothetical protein